MVDILSLKVLKMPGEHKKSSSVWKFFTKVNGTESSCNICDQVCRSSGNTTNLRNHLRTKHVEAYKALFEMSDDLDGVCATSRMEWGQCHSPEVDDTPTDGSAEATVNKEPTVKKEKRKYTKRKKKDIEHVEIIPNPLKNIKIEDVSTVKQEAEHDLDIFGRCVAAQLKKLSEKRAILLTLEINNLVGEARIEDLDEQSANKAAAAENPHVITVSYGDPIQSDDNDGNLEIMQN